MSRRSQSGNVFFALLGAVALVGVLGASLTTFITGPAATMVTVTNKSKADTQMQIATRLAVVEAVHQGSGGDCDDDGTIEPLPPQDAGSSPAPLGGGHLPAALGAAQLDPWGTPYGYCAWNHGALNADNGCSGNLLAGTNYPEARTRTALAIISAGPDRRFDTMCGPHPVYVDRNGDDLVMAYTYAEAIEASGGLWVLKSGEPSTATINRDVEVQGAFRMGIAGETQGTVGAGACGSPEHINRMRYNSFDEKIEVCSFVSPNYVWRPISSLELWALHENQQDIFYTGGNVGIGITDPAQLLTLKWPGNSPRKPSLKAHGVQGDFYLSVQDNTGRVNMYWNTSGGSSPVFGNGGEHALNLKMHTNGYAFNFADGNAAATGDPIEWTTLMRINPQGQVGIGTHNPSSKLHVHHEDAAPESWQDGAITVTNSHAPEGMLALGNGTAAANTFLPMVLGYPVGNRATMVISEILPADDDASHAWPAMSFQARVAGSSVSAVANRAVFDWRNNMSRLMTMTANGNVGIGTTEPQTKLHVSGNIRIDAGARYQIGGQDFVGEGSTLYSTVVGNTAGQGNTGVFQTALGYHAGRDNAGGSQVALGYYAGHSNTGGVQTAIGSHAGRNNTEANQTAMGYYAGADNTGYAQTALGRAAGHGNTGSNQTAIGAWAGEGNTGNDVVAIGYQAGRNNPHDNVFIVQQRNINTTPLIWGNFSTGNVGIGITNPNAKLRVFGEAIVGTNNIDSTLSGQGSFQAASPLAGAGFVATPWIYARAIEGDQRGTSPTLITIGGQNGFTSDDQIGFITLGLQRMHIDRHGRVGIGTNEPSYLLHVEGTAYATGAAGALSDRRHKDDVRDLEFSGLAKINRLRPVSFYWKVPADPGMESEQFGFIAQEIEEVLPQVVLTHGEGDEETKGIKPTALIPVLVKALQELKALFENLIDRLEYLFDRVNMLAQHNDRQDAIIAEQAAIIAGLETANRDVLYRLEKLEAAYPESCH